MEIDRQDYIQLTVDDTVLSLKRSIRDYIEAAYHISDPSLVSQRLEILNNPGVISQLPFIETTQKFKKHVDYAELGLESDFLEILGLLSRDDGVENRRLVYPPYHHQSEALRATIVERKSLMVMTGTGSGKTETFLFPILGKLTKEAAVKPDSFYKNRAIRALILYPMNALVNDQLGRMRLLFGDSRLVEKFKSWSGRTVQFARYTSRTPYPGTRDASGGGDGVKLKPIKDFYVDNLEISNDPSHPDYESRRTLVAELKQRGKWPAKPDLVHWWGSGRWADSEGLPRRCITLESDSELITRHEVKENPPDILITNYSMLEYMLMRPVEKSIFDATQQWLSANPDEDFLLVVDEAHLYRGAQGTEVAHLIRRLRTRLGISPDRLQVICTTASFDSADYAPEFAAQLSGKSPGDFEIIQGDLDLLSGARPATQEEAITIGNLKIGDFYRDISDPEFREQVNQFLASFGSNPTGDLQRDLFNALPNFPPMAHLVNITMGSAWQLASLRKEVFPTLDKEAGEKALTTMIALGTFAKNSPESSSLMPCRVHAFFRGLPGLWICMDPNCAEQGNSRTSGAKSIAGKLYHQPREICGPSCRARVLEFYTCRDCGAAYVRAYTGDTENPVFLWIEGGETGPDDSETLHPIDILLQEPDDSMLSKVEPREFDLVTGRIDTSGTSERWRLVYIYDLENDGNSDAEEDGEDDEESDAEPRQFRRCGVCNSNGIFGHSPVMDHQTKGDQPFSALVNEQIQVQYPNPAVRRSKFNSLRGRKVLGFSDSRQQAARLAPKISEYSSQDTLRPLALVGFERLRAIPEISNFISLDHLYLAAQLGSIILDGRMPPGVGNESSNDSAARDIYSAIEAGDQNAIIQALLSYPNMSQANSTRGLIHGLIKNRRFGFEALGLASVVEAPSKTGDI